MFGSGPSKQEVKMATLITAERATKLETVPTFKECYALVGCSLLEIVRLGNGSILLVDEEGLFNAPVTVNEIASEMAGTTLVGKAVLLDKAEAKKVLG